MTTLMARSLSVATAALLAGLAACSAPAVAGTESSTVSAPSDVAAVDQRIGHIQIAVKQWQDAASLPAAKAAAEAAHNLVTGPGVTGYGDLDGDGTVNGGAEVGLLPGADGRGGLASSLARCAGTDLLGGSWADPAQRWAQLGDAVAHWTPTDNTFPALASHPQRIAGWAELALRSGDLAEARGYAGHAQTHVNAALAAVGPCR